MTIGELIKELKNFKKSDEVIICGNDQYYDILDFYSENHGFNGVVIDCGEYEGQGFE